MEVWFDESHTWPLGAFSELSLKNLGKSNEDNFRRRVIKFVFYRRLAEIWCTDGFFDVDCGAFREIYRQVCKHIN